MTTTMFVDSMESAYWLSVRYRLLSNPSVRFVSDKNNTWYVASVHHAYPVRYTHTRQCRGNNRLFTRSAATIPAAIMTARTMESSVTLVRSGKQSMIGRHRRRADVVSAGLT